MFKIDKFEIIARLVMTSLHIKLLGPHVHELTHSAVIVLSASLVIAVIVFAMDSGVQEPYGCTIYPGLIL
jgi:preprotein translocase subunit SecE